MDSLLALAGVEGGGGAASHGHGGGAADTKPADTVARYLVVKHSWRGRYKRVLVITPTAVHTQNPERTLALTNTYTFASAAAAAAESAPPSLDNPAGGGGSHGGDIESVTLGEDGQEIVLSARSDARSKFKPIHLACAQRAQLLTDLFQAMAAAGARGRCSLAARVLGPSAEFAGAARWVDAAEEGYGGGGGGANGTGGYAAAAAAAVAGYGGGIGGGIGGGNRSGGAAAAAGPAGWWQPAVLRVTAYGLECLERADASDPASPLHVAWRADYHGLASPGFVLLDAGGATTTATAAGAAAAHHGCPGGAFAVLSRTSRSPTVLAAGRARDQLLGHAQQTARRRLGVRVTADGGGAAPLTAARFLGARLQAERARSALEGEQPIGSWDVDALRPRADVLPPQLAHAAPSALARAVLPPGGGHGGGGHGGGGPSPAWLQRGAVLQGLAAAAGGANARRTVLVVTPTSLLERLPGSHDVARRHPLAAAAAVVRFAHDPKLLAVEWADGAPPSVYACPARDGVVAAILDAAQQAARRPIPVLPGLTAPGDVVAAAAAAGAAPPSSAPSSAAGTAQSWGGAGAPAASPYSHSPATSLDLDLQRLYCAELNGRARDMLAATAAAVGGSTSLQAAAANGALLAAQRAASPAIPGAAGGGGARAIAPGSPLGGGAGFVGAGFNGAPPGGAGAAAAAAAAAPLSPEDARLALHECVAEFNASLPYSGVNNDAEVDPAALVALVSLLTEALAPAAATLAVLPLPPAAHQQQQHQQQQQQQPLLAGPGAAIAAVPSASTSALSPDDVKRAVGALQCLARLASTPRLASMLLATPGAVPRAFAALACGADHVTAEAARLLARLWAPGLSRRGAAPWRVGRGGGGTGAAGGGSDDEDGDDSARAAGAAPLASPPLSPPRPPHPHPPWSSPEDELAGKSAKSACFPPGARVGALRLAALVAPLRRDPPPSPLAAAALLEALAALCLEPGSRTTETPLLEASLEGAASLGRPLFALFSHPSPRVAGGAAVLMRAVADGGGCAAAPMREAALREGALLQHLRVAAAGACGGGGGGGGGAGGGGSVSAKARLSQQLVAAWADDYAPALALMRRVLPPGLVRYLNVPQQQQQQQQQQQRQQPGGAGGEGSAAAAAAAATSALASSGPGGVGVPSGPAASAVPVDSLAAAAGLAGGGGQAAPAPQPSAATAAAPATAGGGSGGSGSTGGYLTLQQMQAAPTAASAPTAGAQPALLQDAAAAASAAAAAAAAAIASTVGAVSQQASAFGAAAAASLGVPAPRPPPPPPPPPALAPAAPQPALPPPPARGLRGNWPALWQALARDHCHAGLVWNEGTRQELRSALEREEAGLSARRARVAHGGGAWPAWNWQEFAVPYPSLSAQLCVGGVYVRLLLEGRDAGAVARLGAPREFFFAAYNRLLLLEGGGGGAGGGWRGGGALGDGGGGGGGAFPSAPSAGGGASGGGGLGGGGGTSGGDDPSPRERRAVAELCVRAMAAAYSAHAGDVGPVDGVPYLLRLADATPSRALRHALLLLLQALVAPRAAAAALPTAASPMASATASPAAAAALRAARANAYLLMDHGGVELLVDVAAAAHECPERRAASAAALGAAGGSAAAVPAGHLLTSISHAEAPKEWFYYPKDVIGVAGTPGASSAGNDVGAAAAGKGEDAAAAETATATATDETGRAGPVSKAEIKHMWQRGLISGSTLFWAAGRRAPGDPLLSVRELRWMLAEGGGLMGPFDAALVGLQSLRALAALLPAVEPGTGAPLQPAPRAHRAIASGRCLPRVAQVMLTGEPALVAASAALIAEVLAAGAGAGAGDGAMPRLYLTGAFFFALCYCGSNLLEVATLLHVAHLAQAHRGPEALAAARGREAALPLARRSYLAPLLPESLLHVLHSYGPAVFAEALAGDHDTPEIVWTHGMRFGRLVPALLQHLGDLPHRLAEHYSSGEALYEYTPPPPLAWPELEREVWCHRYYLRHLADEARFGGWRVVDHVQLLQALLAQWREELGRRPLAMSERDAAAVLGLGAGAGAGAGGGAALSSSSSPPGPPAAAAFGEDEMRRAYRNLARRYHPDKNPSPEARVRFLEVQRAYERLQAGAAGGEGPQAWRVLLMLRAQCVLFRRYPRELAPYKYAGYGPLLEVVRGGAAAAAAGAGGGAGDWGGGAAVTAATGAAQLGASSAAAAAAAGRDETGPVSSSANFFSGERVQLVSAAVDLAWLTCTCCPRNAEELFRAGGAPAMAALLERCLGVLSLRDAAPTEPAAAVAAAVLRTVAGLAAVPGAREAMAARGDPRARQLLRDVVRSLGFERCPALVDAALVAVAHMASSPALQEGLLRAGVLAWAVPLLLGYDGTLAAEARSRLLLPFTPAANAAAATAAAAQRAATAGAGDDDPSGAFAVLRLPALRSNAQEARSQHALLAARALARLAGLLPGAHATPRCDPACAALRALLTDSLADRLAADDPRAVLACLGSSVETAQVIWNSAMRAELLDLLERQREAGFGGEEEDDDEEEDDQQQQQGGAAAAAAGSLAGGAAAVAAAAAAAGAIFPASPASPAPFRGIRQLAAFRYSGLRSELQVGGIFVRVFNARCRALGGAGAATASTVGPGTGAPDAAAAAAAAAAAGMPSDPQAFLKALVRYLYDRLVLRAASGSALRSLPRAERRGCLEALEAVGALLAREPRLLGLLSSRSAVSPLMAALVPAAASWPPLMDEAAASAKAGGGGGGSGETDGGASPALPAAGDDDPNAANGAGNGDGAQDDAQCLADDAERLAAASLAVLVRCCTQSAGCVAAVCDERAARLLLWLSCCQAPSFAVMARALVLLRALSSTPEAALAGAYQGGAVMLLGVLLTGAGQGGGGSGASAGGVGLGGGGGGGDGGGGGEARWPWQRAAAARARARGASAADVAAAVLASAPSRADEDAARAAVAGILARVCAHPSHGPRAASVLGALLPPGLAAAVRDGPPDAALAALSASAETPELVWDARMADAAAAEAAALAHAVRAAHAAACAAEVAAGAAAGSGGGGGGGGAGGAGSTAGATAAAPYEWSPPAGYAGPDYGARLGGELHVGGVYVRFFLKNPRYPVRDPKAFCEGLMEAYLSRAASAASDASASASAAAEGAGASGGGSTAADPVASSSSALLLLSAAAVALLQVHPLLADHAAALGYAGRLLALLARRAAPAAAACASAAAAAAAATATAGGSEAAARQAAAAAAADCTVAPDELDGTALRLLHQLAASSGAAEALASEAPQQQQQQQQQQQSMMAAAAAAGAAAGDPPSEAVDGRAGPPAGVPPTPPGGARLMPTLLACTAWGHGPALLSLEAAVRALQPGNRRRAALVEQGLAAALVPRLLHVLDWRRPPPEGASEQERAVLRALVVDVLRAMASGAGAGGVGVEGGGGGGGGFGGTPADRAAAELAASDVWAAYSGQRHDMFLPLGAADGTGGVVGLLTGSATQTFALPAPEAPSPSPF